MGEINEGFLKVVAVVIIIIGIMMGVGVITNMLPNRIMGIFSVLICSIILSLCSGYAKAKGWDKKDSLE